MSTEQDYLDQLEVLRSQPFWKSWSNNNLRLIAAIALAGGGGAAAPSLSQADIKAAIESATNLDSLESLLANLGTYTDGLESLQTTLNGYVDGLEGLETAIRDRLNAVSFATDTLQTAGNSSLTAINGKLAPLSAGSMPVVLPAAQVTALTPPSNTGYATSALQTAGNTSLANIDTSGRDLQVIGASTNTANNNILLATAGAGSLDTKLTASYRSLTVQITPAAVTNASIFFEQSNDGTQWRPLSLVDVDYIWTGLRYSSCTFVNSTSRIFQGSIECRYVRFRLNNAASAAVVATTILSPEKFTYPDRTFPSSNLLLTAELNGSAGGTYVAAPASPLQIYFCGAAVNAGAAQQVEDWWIGVNLPGGRKLGTFSSGATTPESGNIYPPCPLPCGVGNALSGYQNNGAGNMWSSVFYFIAP